ncbi:hypothetical protein GCM10023189_36570 [Nibrella saemangeumensis]|uniref:Uncharacterized protein n=1 Tax=Nibrella saemangeumensis TaxID=1084526 RepID=A0ABP8N4J4_9BACT
MESYADQSLVAAIKAYVKAEDHMAGIAKSMNFKVIPNIGVQMDNEVFIRVPFNPEALMSLKENNITIFNDSPQYSIVLRRIHDKMIRFAKAEKRFQEGHSLMVEQDNGITKLINITSELKKTNPVVYEKIINILRQDQKLRRIWKLGGNIFHMFNDYLKGLLDGLPIEYYNYEFEQAFFQAILIYCDNLDNISSEVIRKAYYKRARQIRLQNVIEVKKMDEEILDEFKNSTSPPSVINQEKLPFAVISYIFQYENMKINELNKNEIAAKFGHKAKTSGFTLLNEYYLPFESVEGRTLRKGAAKQILSAIPHLTTDIAIKKAEKEYTIAIQNKGKKGRGRTGIKLVPRNS